MRDWENLVADKQRLITRHYTKGRQGHEVNFVGIHYNAGNLTIEGCYSVWMAREASAHYQVEDDGTDGQLVWDGNTAWALGDWDANVRSISIEHANRPDGTITEKALDDGAHITAAICKYYGLGRPQWGKNVFPHKHFVSTSCPGQIYGSQKSAYIKRAQYWYDQMTGKPSSGGVWQVEVDGVIGEDTIALKQAIEGIDVTGEVYRQPKSNASLFAAGQCWTFHFVSDPGTGSLVVRRIQNELGIPWKDCDGWWGPDTTKRFIKKWFPGASQFERLCNPSTAAKAWQRDLNAQAKKLKIKR